MYAIRSYYGVVAREKEVVVCESFCVVSGLIQFLQRGGTVQDAQAYILRAGFRIVQLQRAHERIVQLDRLRDIRRKHKVLADQALNRCFKAFERHGIDGVSGILRHVITSYSIHYTKLYDTLVLGYPAVRYQRTVQREPADVLFD